LFGSLSTDESTVMFVNMTTGISTDLLSSNNLEITEAIPPQAGAVAEVDGDVIGWVTWASEGDLGEIAWISVSPDHHRHGIGARLIKCAEDRLRHCGVTTVEVERLGESVDYEPYERTHAFYRAIGFRDFKRVMTNNPGMPESLTLRKPLSPELENRQACDDPSFICQVRSRPGIEGIATDRRRRHEAQSSNGRGSLCWIVRRCVHKRRRQRARR
jgi:GNAT superfamily N-acetyltransferase